MFNADNEIWVVSSSVKECWRCRIYLSTGYNISDKFEMALSDDDHILDHISANVNVSYACYTCNNPNNRFKLVKSTVDSKQAEVCKSILQDIMKNYYQKFKDIKMDMELLNIPGISLDCRVDNGYDFHDFDVAYGDIAKVIDYYVTPYTDEYKLKE